jgi:dihydroorotase
MAGCSADDDSMNAGMKDMLNVMSKFLALGMPVEDVIRRSTWNPAREIKREDLGHLSVGAIADVAVLSIPKGEFGFVDMYGAKLRGDRKFVCELTLKDGRVVYDLNGVTRPDWTTLPTKYNPQGEDAWDATIGHRPPSYQAPRKH